MMFFKKLKNSIIIFLSLFISMPQIAFAYSDYIIASGENVGIKINSIGILVVGLYVQLLPSLVSFKSAYRISL